MTVTTARLRLHPRLTAGVSTATFARESDGVVLGHAVRRCRADGRTVWHVTDDRTPPFVVEQQRSDAGPGWLLTRPDGVPFARIAVASSEPLDLTVIDGGVRVLRLHADGTLSAGGHGDRLGRLDLEAAVSGDVGGAVLELPTGADHTLRAAFLTIPLCVLPDHHEEPAPSRR
jgi:hypothetical protein